MKQIVQINKLLSLFACLIMVGFAGCTSTKTGTVFQTTNVPVVEGAMSEYEMLALFSGAVVSGQSSDEEGQFWTQTYPEINLGKTNGKITGT